MFTRILFLFLFATLSLPGFGQLPAFTHHTEREKPADTTSLQHFFSSGTLYGHSRYYYMLTDNIAPLTDFFSNSFGMGIGYETAPFKGFQMGISGFFIYNLHSSDFTKPDPVTGMGSRYEIGQFDLLNPTNKRDMDRLEDLYIKYSYKNLGLKLGKQHIRQAFINPQDGRMRPTLAEGLLFEYSGIKNFQAEGGYLFGISPRSTVGWFDIGESIGIFPQGVNTDGTKADYKNNLHSDAVYYLNLTFKKEKKFQVSLLNQTIDRLQHSAMLQVNSEIELKPELNGVFGGQYIEQFSLASGNNALPGKAWVEQGERARTFGFRLGVKNKSNWQVLANYNRITALGRYLMPREWGRDPFFTFMSRERNEGFADVHAINASLLKSLKKSGLKAELSYGHYYLPDVQDYQKNKNGMPSYRQLNLDIRYPFQQFLKGLELQGLLVYKGNLGETYGNNKYVINKVDMVLYNFIVNYHF
ncbi:MAG: OprD family outer membrane porin [Bacteroidia bacterium]|nr:OprD family outer membrane porin [Bacteroidia bacterium]